MVHKLKSIAMRYNLATIYAFGSRAEEISEVLGAKGEHSKLAESDVDIGVQPEFSCRLSARDKVCLTIDLEDLFQAQRVDLVVIPEAGAFLALDIIKGRVLYCKNWDEQAEEELFILRRAGDLAYYERKGREQILSIGK